jgi:hypothetical protein
MLPYFTGGISAGRRFVGCKIVLCGLVIKNTKKQEIFS